MGAIVTYIVFGVSALCSPLFPYIGAMGYVWFVAMIPTFLWRYSLFDYQFEFQKYIAIATIAGFVLSGLRGLSLTSTAKISICGLLLYWGASTVGTFYSIEPDRSWFFLEQISKVFLMSLVITKVMDSGRRVYTIIWIIIASTGWNCLEINRDYYSRGFSNVNQDGWAFQNANGYALIATMVSLICVSMYLSVRRWSLKILYIGIALICVHAIFIVESRGGMLGLIAGGLIILAISKKSFALFASYAAALVMVLLLAGPSVVQEFTSSFVDDETLDRSASDRFIIWKGGVELSLDYPIIGVGPWAAEKIMASQYASQSAVATTGRVHLHNLPLEITTGSGVPAFLGYCIFFFLPCYSLWKKRGESLGEHFNGLRVGLISAIFGYWVASFFNSGALLEIPYMIASATIALQSLAENKRLIEEESFIDSDESESYGIEIAEEDYVFESPTTESRATESQLV